MKQEMYVIATRVKDNKEMYLAIDEERSNFEFYDTIVFKWVENIDDAYMTFEYRDVENTAKSYFKNYNKWYIKKYDAIFN